MFQPDTLKHLLDDKPKATPAPYTLNSLIAWLEGLPSDASYDWGCTYGRCLIGQYAYANGLDSGYDAQTNSFRKTGPMFFFRDGTPSPISLAEKIAVSPPHTFGAALERARACRDAEGQ